MAELLVRHVDARLVSELEHRALQHGVSVEEEHRRILREVLVTAKTRPSFKEHLLSMPDVGEDWMFDRRDPRNALPERKPFDFHGRLRASRRPPDQSVGVA
jgi:plasmid stability protein